MEIAFYHRFRSSSEAELLAQALAGELTSGGPLSCQTAKTLEDRFHLPHALLTPSCTHALEMACHLLELRPGDEVLLPSFNFPSAANAVLLAGGTPVLCDVDVETQTLCLADAARRITPRTRAVIAVHYAGVSCDMDALVVLCAAHGLSLIEDAAQGADAYYRGRALGSLGRFGCYSFHHTKNLSCGEGGALACGEGDLRAAEIFRDKGTDRSSFLRGETARYEWVGVGSSPVLSEACSALLLAQLRQADGITARLLSVLALYREVLAALEDRGLLHTMVIPEYATPNGHIFYVHFLDAQRRDRAMTALKAAGVECHTHYVPLHLSPMGRALGYGADDLPESRRTWETLLRLPIHTGMGPEQVAYIADILEGAVGT